MLKSTRSNFLDTRTCFLWFQAQLKETRPSHLLWLFGISWMATRTFSANRWYRSLSINQLGIPMLSRMQMNSSRFPIDAIIIGESQRTCSSTIKRGSCLGKRPKGSKIKLICWRQSLLWDQTHCITRFMCWWAWNQGISGWLIPGSISSYTTSKYLIAHLEEFAKYIQATQDWSLKQLILKCFTAGTRVVRTETESFRLLIHSTCSWEWKRRCPSMELWEPQATTRQEIKWSYYLPRDRCGIYIGWTT